MENKAVRNNRKKKKVRKALGTEGYRLSISRTNKRLFCQIIDLKDGKVILGLSDKNFSKEKKATKTEKALAFGESFAVAALKKGIKAVKFDRGCYLYHGRVKAFAEGARKGGLHF